MFTRISPDIAETVTIQFEGRDLKVRKGLTIAAALLESGISHFRETPVTNSPRAPYCMMGVCFECLVVVDAMANQQSCMMQVQDGMKIERQTGVADVMGESHSEAQEKP